MDVDAGLPEEAPHCAAVRLLKEGCTDTAEGSAVDRGLHIWDAAGQADCGAGAATVCAAEDLQAWHPDMQSSHVAQALLLALRGTYGAVVRPVGDPLDAGRGASFAASHFQLCDGVSASVAATAAPLLQLCSHRALLWATGRLLTTSFEYGLVNQALGAALLDLCMGLHELVCELWDEVLPEKEGGACGPVAHIVHALSSYAPLFELAARAVQEWARAGCEVEDGVRMPVRGSAVLCLLESVRDTFAQTFHNGDTLMSSLIHHTARPLLRMLDDWVYRGDLEAAALASSASAPRSLHQTRVVLPAPEGRPTPYHALETDAARSERLDAERTEARRRQYEAHQWAFPFELPIVQKDAGGTHEGFAFLNWGVDEARLPGFVKSHPDNVSKLLEAGKLALVIAESGGEYHPVQLCGEDDLSSGLPLSELVTLRIHDAWVQANSAVLDMLSARQSADGVPDRLCCGPFFEFLRTYYLCGNATWLADVAERCNARPQCSFSRTPRDINWQELQRQLTDVLCGFDATPQRLTNAFDLRFEAATTQLCRCLRKRTQPAFTTELPLVTTLQLAIDVPPPLSLLFTPDHRMKYNYLFRLLFRLKMLHADLNRCRRGRRTRSATPVVFLAYAMQAFLCAFETYVTVEVVEPNYATLVKALRSVETVSALLDAHNTFLDKCLAQTLAYNEPCLKLLEKVLLSVKLYSEAGRRDVSMEITRRFATQYSERLQEFLACMEQGSATDEGALLQHLIRRLDFNGFYAKHRRAAQLQAAQQNA